MIFAKNIHKYYDQLHVLKGVDLDIKKGELYKQPDEGYIIISKDNIYVKILEKKNGESITLRYVDRTSIILEDGDVVHRHMMDGDPILFNRQPTLHRMSMMAHIARIMTRGDTFRMNVADGFALATGSVKSV